MTPIATLLDQVDNGFILLPEFQRGYVWNRDQVKRMFESLYRGYPIGGLLFWNTASSQTATRGTQSAAVNPTKLLLDGQQRITSLYGVFRGGPPDFFDGNPRAFQDLYFNLGTEEFEFYQPLRMQGDARWVSVTEVIQRGVGPLVKRFGADPELAVYIDRAASLQRIKDTTLNEDVIANPALTVEQVVDIFNRVNSGGTKLSTGDLALARICADWPQARDEMKKHLERWRKAGFDRFSLDWLLRSVNAVLNGEARFHHLHGVTRSEVEDALARAAKSLDYIINLISSQLGLDNGQVLFGRNALPVMAHYVDRQNGQLSPREQRQLLYWYVRASMHGIFSGTPETELDQAMAAIEDLEEGLDRLIQQLELRVGSSQIRPEHFDAATAVSRFFPVLYMLTRVADARNFCDGSRLSMNLVGAGGKLDRHHIFPRALLKRNGYSARDINALANYCFQTQQCNLKIGATPPEEYFDEAVDGSLASQWIPESKDPWTVDRYPEFLGQRRELLAAAANDILNQFRNGPDQQRQSLPASGWGAHIDEEEEADLRSVQQWLDEIGLSRGEIAFDIPSQAIESELLSLDLAWPDGVQLYRSDRVALLLNEEPGVFASANAAGFRCFDNSEQFKRYVEREVLSSEPY